MSPVLPPVVLVVVEGMKSPTALAFAIAFADTYNIADILKLMLPWIYNVNTKKNPFSPANNPKKVIHHGANIQKKPNEYFVKPESIHNLLYRMEMICVPIKI